MTGSAEWAGGERHLLDLLSTLGRAFETRVVTPEHGPLVQRLESLGIGVKVVELRPLGSLRPVGELEKAIRRFKPALVQSHGARSNFYARLACARAGVPHVATVHNSLYDYPVSRWRKGLYLAMDRAFASHSAAVVCVCESLRRDLVHRQRLPEKLVRVVHNGVDVHRFAPGRGDREKFRRELGFGDTDWVVGVVGRMTEQKGQLEFLEAFKAFAARQPDARAALVGSGPLKPDLEAAIRRLHLADRVRLGPPREDVEDVFAGLDAVALPSRSEGLPYVVLEALAMERPVVATSVNGVPEALDGGVGLLVPPRDPKALAEALRTLRRDAPAAFVRAKLGRRRVEKEFSLKAMAQGWRSVYVEVIGSKP